MGILRWVLLAIFGGIACVLVAVGGWQAREQQRKIATYIATPARVQSASVRVSVSTDSKGRKSYTYYPQISYAYAVGGEAKFSDVVTPLSRGGKNAWASQVVAQFSDLSKQYEAYYNPANPDEAFLVRRHYYDPYLALLFGLPFFSVGAFLFYAVNPNASCALPPRPRPGGWHELRPARSVASKQNLAWILTGVWFGWLALVSGHYYAIAEPPYVDEALGATTVFGALGLIPLSFMIYYFRLGRMLKEARLFVRADRHAIGEPIIAHVEQAVRAAIKVDAFKIGLICERHTREQRGGKTRYSTETAHEAWTELAAGLSPRAGELLQGDAEIWIPGSGRPTSPASQKEYPKHTWMLVVQTQIPGAPDYKGKFLIDISPRAAAPPSGAGFPD